MFTTRRRSLTAPPQVEQPQHAVIRDSHRDLLDWPPVAALTTLMPDGSPHTTPVWCEFDGTYVLVNTMRGFLKERNMRRDPRVTLLCYDPARTLRSLEVRGHVVEMTEDGAAEQLDRLGERYTGRRFFSDLVATGQADGKTPVLCKILALKVVAVGAT
jgi:PPOX class probable F420-dependent enzyme